MIPLWLRWLGDMLNLASSWLYLFFVCVAQTTLARTPTDSVTSGRAALFCRQIRRECFLFRFGLAFAPPGVALG